MDRCLYQNYHIEEFTEVAVTIVRWQKMNARKKSQSQDKHNYCYFFCSLKLIMFYRETYIERGKDESSNDRNDRAIRVATRLVQDPVQMIFQFFSLKELGFDLIASIANN